MFIQTFVPLAPLSTLRVGGAARHFTVVRTPEELADAITYANKNALPIFILGGGSNVLISDEGFAGLVIKIELCGVTFEKHGTDIFVVAAAGEEWDRLVSACVSQGFYGMENLSGIPGLVGGAPIQNIGAYGAEVKNVIRWVEVYDTRELAYKKLSQEECVFSYRDSIFKHEAGAHFIVTRVCFRLTENETLDLSYKDLATYCAKHVQKPTLADVRQAVLSIRAHKFPDLTTTGTAGSFFKNPIVTKEKAATLKSAHPDLPLFSIAENQVKVPLAWILDHVCHLKGVRHENVGTFERQPLVLITYAGATSREIEAFAAYIQKEVRNKTGIEIEHEVTCIEK